MNQAIRQLKQPQGRCLTAILANCGDSGSPKYEDVYFISQASAEKRVADPDFAYRLKKADPQSKDQAPDVVYRQVEAWVDADGKYYIYKGESVGLVEVFVVN